MRHCAHCGAGIDPGVRTCGRCGSRPSLADAPGRDAGCDACGEPVAASWRHCVSCGAPIEAATQSRVVRTSIDAEARPAPPVDEEDGEPEGDADTGSTDRWPAQLHR